MSGKNFKDCKTIPEFLEYIKDELVHQDNHATSYPIYCVYEQRVEVGYDPRLIGEDGIYPIYYELDSMEELIQDEMMNEYHLDRSEVMSGINPDPDNIYVTGAKLIPRFVSPHFTERSAYRYVRENRHNLNYPYIYVHSLNRCDEMIYIRSLLMAGDVIGMMINEHRANIDSCGSDGDTK